MWKSKRIRNDKFNGPHTSQVFLKSLHGGKLRKSNKHEQCTGADFMTSHCTICTYITISHIAYPITTLVVTAAMVWSAHAHASMVTSRDGGFHIQSIILNWLTPSPFYADRVSKTSCNLIFLNQLTVHTVTFLNASQCYYRSVELCSK